MSSRNLLAAITVASLIFSISSMAQARYAYPELEEVPIETLSTNLKAMTEKNPEDAGLLLNLARLHAMAYARKVEKVQVKQGKQELGAWFGFEPAHVPFRTKPSNDKEVQERAKAHLEKAITYYRKTIALNEKNLTAQLGLGWCLKEAGETEAAIQQLRKAAEAGWQKEGAMKYGGLGKKYITVEAAEYLIPLLDEEEHAFEITVLKERSEQVSRLPRAVTPIAVPLVETLTPAEMLNPEAKVTFDADGSGRQLEWSWIRSNSGWLVYDRKGDGNITSAIQMFGSVTFWLYWENGYQALAGLDDNRDGELTGDELEHFAIWQDQNENGISEPGEVTPLADHGIVAVSCQANRSEEAGVAASSLRGVRFADGTTRATYDLILDQAP